MSLQICRLFSVIEFVSAREIKNAKVIKFQIVVKPLGLGIHGLGLLIHQELIHGLGFWIHGLGFLMRTSGFELDKDITVCCEGTLSSPRMRRFDRNLILI